MPPRRLDPPPGTTYVRSPDPAYTRGWNDCLLQMLKAMNLRVCLTGSKPNDLVFVHRGTRQLYGMGSKADFRYALTFIEECKTVTQRLDGKFYLSNK